MDKDLRKIWLRVYLPLTQALEILKSFPLEEPLEETSGKHEAISYLEDQCAAVRAWLRLKANSPKLMEVLPLIRAYYAKQGNGSGGSLHAVLDDGNMEEEFVLSGLAYADLRDDIDGVKIATLLLGMSEDQRDELYAIL